MHLFAAIDARRRTCPRWHDMAVGVNLIYMKSLTELIQIIRKVSEKFGSFRLENEKQDMAAEKNPAHIQGIYKAHTRHIQGIYKAHTTHILPTPKTETM